MTLEELVAQLRDAYEATLRAVVLYGSAAVGEHDPKRSDYNVLVVASEIPLGRLRELSAVTRAWRDAGNHPPMTFTEKEWVSSADVFPMEYADILERHRVLFGELPLAEIVVRPAHLRLQVEHEARGVLLRLRGAVLLAGGDEGDQLKLMTASLSSLLIVFRGILRLHGKRPPTANAEVVRETGQVTGVNVSVFTEVVKHVRGEEEIAKGRAGAVLVAYLRGMEAIVAHIDSLPDPA